MVEGKTKRKSDAALYRGDRATKGHDIAMARGGNRDIWIWMCRKCNKEQSTHSFRQWAGWLRIKGDPRADYVDEVADFIEDWRNTHDIPARTFERQAGFSQLAPVACDAAE